MAVPVKTVNVLRMVTPIKIINDLKKEAPTEIDALRMVLVRTINSLETDFLRMERVGMHLGI